MNKRLIITGTILLILFAPVSMGRAAPPLQARSIITYPEDGATLSGEVEIKGIATHPNILWYEVDYAAGAEPAGDSKWVPIEHAENTQVEEGVLAKWDTTQVPDGQYTLALTVAGEGDSRYYQSFVTHLTVNNAEAAQTPTPEQEQEGPTTVPTAVTVSTPTPVTVEQPATSTPRPTSTPQPGIETTTTPSTGGGGGSNIAIDGGELRDAFCTGGFITLLLLLLWGLYLMARNGLRWYLRQRSGPPLD